MNNQKQLLKNERALLTIKKRFLLIDDNLLNQKNTSFSILSI